MSLVSYLDRKNVVDSIFKTKLLGHFKTQGRLEEIAITAIGPRLLCIFSFCFYTVSILLYNTAFINKANYENVLHKKKDKLSNFYLKIK